MKRYYYDLHLHSCLSPCGDDDMTPANIAGMACLNGLQIIALTDHNSTKNAPAIISACEKHGIVAIPGMEITTAEDIHLVALFPSAENAAGFEEKLSPYRIHYKNPVDIYGHQYVMDENDEVIAEEPYLLSNALMLPLEDAVTLVRDCGGLVYPAHIDREANGIVAILGTIPENLCFTTVEIHDKENISDYVQKFGLSHEHIVISSDAHYLWDIQDAVHYFEFDEALSADEIRREVIMQLGKRK